MMAKSRVSLLGRLTLFLLLTALFVAPGFAQVAKQSNDVLTSLQFVHEKLNPGDEAEPLDNVRAIADKSLQNGWEAFRIGAGPAADWNAQIDKRTGLVGFAEGGNIAWVPGHGNHMTNQDLAGFLKAKPTIDLEVMDAVARDFMPRVKSMMGFDPSQLVINRGRSGQPGGHLWFVDYDLVREGLAVEGARVVFRVNNGNLIQYGTENMPAPGAVVPPTRLTKKQAMDAVAKYIGGFQVGDTFRDKGSLHLLPSAISAKTAEGFEFGKGRGIAKVWQVVFHRDGVMGTWRARVDAATGEVLELSDINDYAAAQATGGIYQNSPTTGSEIVRPMPYADYGTGTYANSAGIYNWTSGTKTSTLNGQYVKITDSCGAISRTSDATGNFLFGTSTGTNCTIPAGGGGAGNTHSSREQFYQVNRIKEVVRGWLPSNAWINGKLTVNVNLNQTCNAYWNGSTLNFFKSGGGCNNTGEISGVSLHEFGHGIDQNDGTGTATDGATGESYGDTTALIALHASCLGAGFLSSNCSGYGDACTSCTGVRDADYAKHTSNTPATANNFIRVAWTILDRLWYLSRNTATKSFSCTTGSTYTSNGCSAGSLWKVMRAVDDDNGNLNDGTPHGGALFAAFNRHGIACTTDTGASTTFAGCTPPASPTLSITAGTNSAALSWTGSGVYNVFRNETGCNAGFTKIASATSATSLTDANVANGLTYYYQVTAYPSGNEACASLPSTCVSVTPVSGPPTPDFAISASPASVSIAQGASGSSTVSTTVSGGFSNAISLSASGQPSGVTVSFSPSSIAAPGSGSSTMNITVGSTVTAGTYTITVTGTGGAITHTTPVSLTVTTVGGGGTTTQILGNPGFETGTASPWTTSTGVVDNTASQPAHGGSWKAWLDGYGTTHTDTLLQTVTISSTATAATLNFYLHIDSAETTTTTAYDTLKVQIRNSSGTVLATLATYSNLNKASGYSLKSFNVLPYKGSAIQVYLVGAEDSSLQTSFVVDDFALNVTTP
jgi:hypothetical protein